MGLRSSVIFIAIAGVYACAAVTGLGDYSIGPDDLAEGGVSSTSSGSTGTSLTSSGTTATSSGSTTSSGDASSGKPADPLGDYAKASCAFVKKCDGLRYAAYYPTDADCENETKADDESWITPAEYSACTAKLTSADCSFRERDFRECDFFGNIPDNGVCSSSRSCSSGHCKRDANTGCGTCTPRAAEGTNCPTISDCVEGAYCTGVNTKCVPQVGLDGDCSATPNACQAGLACNTTTDRCVKPTGTAGAACNGNTCLQGFVCISSKCVEVTYGNPGVACGQQGNGYVSCIRGICVNAKCQAYAKANEACASDLTKPLCDPSIGTCINGKCTDRKSITCP